MNSAHEPFSKGGLDGDGRYQTMMVDMVASVLLVRLKRTVRGVLVASPSHEYLQLSPFNAKVAGTPSTVKLNGGGGRSSPPWLSYALTQKITSDPKNSSLSVNLKTDNDRIPLKTNFKLSVKFPPV